MSIEKPYDEKRRLPIGDDSANTLQWLTIFNDLITLLMVFFVLLFSLGSLNVSRFQNFQNALQSAMGVLNPGQANSDGIISESEIQGQTSNTLNTSAKPSDSLGQWKAEEGVEAEYTPKGIRLILDDHLLFPLGSAQLSNSGLQMLKKVGAIIKPFNRYIRIEGHTDNTPIANRRYPSNWELSASRAIRVVKYFIDESGFSPSILSAAGYGSSRSRAQNDSPENRAKNRRVEIILGEPISLPSIIAQQDNGGN